MSKVTEVAATKPTPAAASEGNWVFDFPVSWQRFHVRDDARCAKEIERFVTKQFANAPEHIKADSAKLITDMRRQMRQHKTNGGLLAVMGQLGEGDPKLSFSGTISEVPARVVGAPEQLLMPLKDRIARRNGVEAAVIREDVVNGQRVYSYSKVASTKARVMGESLDEFDEVNVSYWAQHKAGERVLHISFISHFVAAKEQMQDFFDLIIAGLRWQGPEAVEELPQQ